MRYGLTLDLQLLLLFRYHLRRCATRLADVDRLGPKPIRLNMARHIFPTLRSRKPDVMRVFDCHRMESGPIRRNHHDVQDPHHPRSKQRHRDVLV